MTPPQVTREDDPVQSATPRAGWRQLARLLRVASVAAIGSAVSAQAGQLWSVGRNQNGQLGDGTTVNSLVPFQVASLVTTAAAGGSATEGSHFFQLDTAGVLWGVGYNLYGQLGDGTTVNRASRVPIATGVVAVSAGINHSLFLRNDGTAWAMGFNQYGQLGDGTTTNRATPVMVLAGVAAISAGGNHSLFLKTDGTLWATGYNSFGQLGDGAKPANRLTPAQVAAGVTAVAAGGSHSLFLKSDHTLWVTGWNASGQLGVGPASSYLSVPAQLDTAVQAIAAGNQHSLFVKQDGTLWAMGQNLFGQLGDGTMPTNQKLPVMIDTRVAGVAAGVSHSLYVKTDASLWTMGLNTSGQLGDGTTANRSMPVKIADEALGAMGGAESSYFIKAPGLTTQLSAWTAYGSAPLHDFQAVHFGGGSFVAAANASGGAGAFTLNSLDGLTWSRSGDGALPDFGPTGIAFGGGQYVLVGTTQDGGSGRIFGSTDGLVWTLNSAGGSPLRAIAFANGMFVAVGQGGVIQTSLDGVTWTARASPTGQVLRGIAYGGGKFVAVGDQGAVAVSTDGISWVGAGGGPSSSNNFSAVVYGDGVFVAVGNGVATSADAFSWIQRVSPAADGTNYFAAAYRVGQYVIAGRTATGAGALLNSADAVTWTAQSSGATSPLRALAQGNNRFVIVGDAGTVLTSSSVGSTPVIVTQPLSLTVNAGSAASFNVAATGAAPLTYQWRRNGTAIAGATAASYTIAAADSTDAGSLTVTVANAAGSVTSAAAVLTVIKAAQTISFPVIPTHAYGDAPFALTATATPSGLPVVFSVVSGPATLVGNVVTVTGVGTVTIRASQVGNLSYYAAPNVDRVFAVAKATPVIAWSSPSPITYGTALTTTQLNATAAQLGGFTYSPTEGAVLTAGTTTLSATFVPTDTVNYSSVTVQRTITVNKAIASVSLLGLNPVYDGLPKVPSAVTSPAGLSVAFTYDGLSGPPVAIGSYAVSATITDANYTGSATGTLTIAKAEQAINFPALPNRTFGDAPFTLVASAVPSGLPVSFAVVSGPAIVTGSQVTLTGAGSVVVRASQAGSVSFNAAPSVDRTFTVISPPATITWGTPASIGYGQPIGAAQLNATANVAGTFVYSPASGTVLNAGLQTLTVTFTPVDGSGFSAATKQQTLLVTKAVPVLTWTAPAAITFGTPLSSTQLNPSAGELAGVFVYAPAAGTVLPVGRQTLAATFTPVDSVNYAVASIEQVLTVNKTAATVILGSLVATYDGTPKPATASTSAGALTVELTYNGSANPPSAIGSYTVVGTIVDANYAGSATGTLVIAQASQSISFEPLSDHAFGDAAFGLTATAVPSSLPVSFTVVSGPAVVSGNIVTLRGVGTVVIRASQAGDLSYLPATPVERSFEVLKPTPVVSWPTPAAIVHGTALTALQLNATADVPGTFVYTPSAGSIPDAGTVMLRVVFTATDQATYNPAVVERALTVAPADQTISFAALANRREGAAPFILSATATPSLLPVSFRVVSGPATLAGSTVSLTGTGTVVIEASQGGSANYLAAAPVSRSFTVISAASEPAPGDVNSDGSADPWWKNPVAGQRNIWLMNGTRFSADVNLGRFDVTWGMAAAGDLDGDGQADILWQNLESGQRSIWLMQGTRFVTGLDLGVIDPAWRMVAVGDLTGDGRADIVAENIATGERSIWVLDGSTIVARHSLGAVPVAWNIVAVADFNADGQADLLWENSSTGQRSAWLMRGMTFVAGLELGGAAPSWRLVAAADFDRDGQPDLLEQNRATGAVGIVPLKNAVAGTRIDLGTHHTQWNAVAAVDFDRDGSPDILWEADAPRGGTSADFNGDGKPDLLWSNAITGERTIWLMNGTTKESAASLGIFSAEWVISATGDFDGDTKPDIVWSNMVTGERALWLMNGTSFVRSSTLGIFPGEWTVAATADFNDDGKPDIIWSNSVTGERAIWLMNGTMFLGSSTLGIFPKEWTVAATADFNADGKPDIIWSNSVTGERAIWLMNGTMFLASSTLGIFPLEWTVRGAGDFNADGKPDVIWSNSVTGETAIWLMSGTNLLSSASLGIVGTEWSVRN